MCCFVFIFQEISRESTIEYLYMVELTSLYAELSVSEFKPPVDSTCLYDQPAAHSPL